MILKYILLALSASIDALSLGITYGIKKTKMSKTASIIIFITVLCCSTIALLVGHSFSLFFSHNFSILIGSFLLIMLGSYNIYNSIKKSNSFKNFDIDNSNYINKKDATLLGLAVAIDASCVSMGAGIIGYVSFILPVLMAIFHTLFVNCGNSIANLIVNNLNIPSNILSILSGILLIFIGIFKITL